MILKRLQSMRLRKNDLKVNTPKKISQLWLQLILAATMSSKQKSWRRWSSNGRKSERHSWIWTLTNQVQLRRKTLLCTSKAGSYPHNSSIGSMKNLTVTKTAKSRTMISLKLLVPNSIPKRDFTSDRISSKMESLIPASTQCAGKPQQATLTTVHCTKRCTKTRQLNSTLRCSKSWAANGRNLFNR